MKKVLLGILLIIISIPFAGYFHLRSYLPDYDGKLKVPGLTDAVIIQRNRYAVPSITAQNLADLYFAWGYVNAQDRMFQMEVTKRIGQGRLSEFAGESTLATDIFLRAVGFYDIARKEAQNLSPKYKALLQRYVDGINYYLKAEKKPLYMTLLGLEKEKWKIADSIVVGMMLNWTLAYNLSHELLYHKISKKIGKAKCEELLNFIPPESPTIVDRKSENRIADARFVAMLNKFGPLMGCRSASNNWVIAPSRTSFSGAILANDLHLGSKIPADFYLIRVHANDFELSGGQMAGVPFIPIGYNQDIAWGVTNQGADIVDVFFESVDWDKKTYLFKGKELALKTKAVEIKVKGKQPLQKTLYYAGRRPLLNEVYPEIDEVISIDWPGFDGIGTEGFFKLNDAHNHAEFISAAKQIRISPQNMVYADVDGNIGYRTIGSLLKRKPQTGNFPQLGHQVEANWEGLLDPELNPAVVNPDSGFIATANNRVVRNFHYDMNATYAPRYRYEAIARMIAANDKIDVGYTQKMQCDTKSVLVPKLISIIKTYIRSGDDPLVQKALDAVLDWDGDLKKESVAASIYNTWLVRFMYQTYVDELGKDLATEYVSQRYISLERFFSLLENDSEFFDDISTAEKESAADIASRAFKETLQILADFTGSNHMEDWQWGRIHRIHFDHFLGKSKLLRPFVNYGPFPIGGDCETNLRAHFYDVTPPFTPKLASCIRLIVRFDPEPQGYMVLISGQNEYFLSTHYTDMTDMWLNEEYFSPEEEKAKYELAFVPLNASKNE